MKIKNLKLKISGMHCASCAMNIDGTLEDTDGVKEAVTNYAKGQTSVAFDPKIINEKKIITMINTLEYTAEIESEKL